MKLILCLEYKDKCMKANNTILGCKETICFNVLETLFIFTFSPQTVGVIVRLEKENFQVLSMHNKVNLPHYKIILAFIDIKHLYFLLLLKCLVNILSYFQILNLKPAAVTRKRDTKYAVALDSENNSIQVKDVIKVIDGPHSVIIFPSYFPNIFDMFSDFNLL